MDLLFEIGCEELPASFQKPALEWMAAEMNRGLDDARLNGEGEAERANILEYATPRRLALVVTAVALWRLHPDWGGLLHGALRPAVPQGEGHPSWWYFAIALLGAAMTPYEVFFFSSGAVEDHWTSHDLAVERANVLVGFPLGGVLSLAIMACAALILRPASRQPASRAPLARPGHRTRASPGIPRTS